MKNPGKTVQVTVSLEIDVVSAIDKKRGHKSFSKFVNEILKEALKD